MTRSAYGAAWDLDANRRRLDVTRRVTVPSMAAQTSKAWEWLVAIDISDPLAPERMALFESAGVPVRFIEVRSVVDRQATAAAAYRAPWAEVLGPRNEQLAMTRLDDDDGFAPWAMERVERVARGCRERTALMFPRGLRAYDGRITVVLHRSNAMHTLVTPPGDELHVYAYLHRKVRNVAPVRTVDQGVAWLWSRHPDTISGWHATDFPLTDKIRGLFPAVDWSVFGPSKPRRSGVTPGRCFR